MTRILSTKKLLPNQRQFLLNAAISVVEADFIAVGPIPFTFTDIQDNLIFTSKNAVQAVSAHPDVQSIRRHPAFCVGEKTAELLDEVGFTVLACEDNAEALAKTITEQYADESFTFFCGNLRMDTLPAKLAERRIPCHEIQVYETVLTPVKAEGGFDGILFFSPSGVESFLKENMLSGQTCFCIGETTAAAVQRVTGLNPVEVTNVVIANKPTVENTIIQCLNHYKTPSGNTI